MSQQTYAPEYIQALIDERDEALARNRDLEQWLDAARAMINSLAKRNGELAQCIKDAIAMTEER
jgi:hypothetical protein